MSGIKAILDSNIIILASKSKLDTKALLENYDEFYISIITYMEVYGYEFEDEKEKGFIDELFESMEIIEINKSIADQTILYRKNKLKKIKLPDAIILATARFLNADLITNDLEDFQGIDAKININKAELLGS